MADSKAQIAEVIGSKIYISMKVSSKHANSLNKRVYGYDYKYVLPVSTNFWKNLWKYEYKYVLLVSTNLRRLGKNDRFYKIW